MRVENGIIGEDNSRGKETGKGVEGRGTGDRNHAGCLFF